MQSEGSFNIWKTLSFHILKTKALDGTTIKYHYKLPQLSRIMAVSIVILRVSETLRNATNIYD